MIGPIARALARAESYHQRTTETSKSKFSNEAADQTRERRLREPPSVEQLPASTTPDGSIQTRSSNQIKKRRVQVHKLGQRYKATLWMIEHANPNGEKKIISKCVKEFPQLFPGIYQASLQ